MNTIFRVLFLHLRTFWLCARGLFVSTRFHRLRTSTSSQNVATTAGTTTAMDIYRPPTPMPTSSLIAGGHHIPASLLANSKVAATKVWARARAHDLKARMKGRRVAKKQAMYARMAAVVVGHRKGDVSKYREREEEEEEEEEEEVREEAGEEVEVGVEEVFEALLKSSSLGFGARRSPSPLSISHASTPSGMYSGREYAHPHAHQHALPSPTLSCVSSSSDSSAPPVTPLTPLDFPGTVDVDEAESSPYTVPVIVTARANHHLHLHRNVPFPRPRIQFRTLSASITARSPLSRSFPLSLSLPLAPRRASSPNTFGINRYMNNNDDEGSEEDARARTDRGSTTKGSGEGRREDPFGTHGSAYYAPGAWAALSFGDAYDLSAWTWACDCSPRSHAKKCERQAQHEYCSAHKTAATATGIVKGTGSGLVYRTPKHAASAPQLSYARRADRELKYLRALASETDQATEAARMSVIQPPAPIPEPAHERAHWCRSGMRPLLLPQKLGLTGGGGGHGGSKRGTEKPDTLSSYGREPDKSGWDVDLERGVRRGEGVKT
ncbi:hypothetical protein B0F90DRAFT_1820218 [Multifurca ochricompacta]|uniref:Uncharacterized protein n=1 Tax=Multifurca ochricompacta TaxID=376703 RepID=A0AAD4LYX9_9AGAM|nr:hypothetical protein B0F90DRAFT_1820218 [Multifurca ochricompacta]